MKLSRSQRAAIQFFEEYAKKHKEEACETIEHILKMGNISVELYEKAVLKIKKNARIALHFHPDRPNSDLRTVAEALLLDSVYKSQFETQLSNGSVSAYPGGLRDTWEERIFGGAYQLEGTTNSQRPKYGALNLMLHPDGPAPRFGSCYFLLSPEVSERSTFTYLDSHQDPKEKGTLSQFDMVLSALLVEIFTRDFALGERELTPGRLIHHLLSNLNQPMVDLADQQAVRNLNHYIEAQVHGEISLEKDVEVLVADPSFRNTEVGKTLEQLCLKYAIKLYWHMGFELSVDEVPPDFRGPAMPSLAKRIAKNNVVNASVIGRAIMDLKQNPDAWSERGTYSEVLQELKLLWHVLVKVGKPHYNGDKVKWTT
ncbi:hypothetical protein AWM68_02920 [Fictibacillus phosphorivorans]|uniref:DUF3626 domain-containing protein n=1 Tax=Fictibacillus phosphorivorans TaxID=1221500 RepID=A0A161RWZ1_9BACL|nr:DUF3626 domain-containing protein [Fictibacillus phosphorivorans]KZE69236.1 hypothetical protein AWM68_02920 [Fictibacillus phosphorivorans]